MKIATLATSGLIFAGLASPAFAAVPLDQQLGSVPPDIFHAMSGNFSAAHGYTGDLTLWATSSDRARVNKQKPPLKPISSSPAAVPEFKSPMEALRYERPQLLGERQRELEPQRAFQRAKAQTRPAP